MLSIVWILSCYKLKTEQLKENVGPISFQFTIKIAEDGSGFHETITTDHST